ncbi:MAG: hypothetical protein CM15mP78_11950 [Candidatus Poseidoniales archaeon]|nr:MAG: hypothetical protein CM15mP78_11950 [Candidatus Poseidoniales archaeon]
MKSARGLNPSMKVRASGVLSHVRSDGRTVRIDLHNSTQPLTIVAATLELAEHHPIRYIVGRGEARAGTPNCEEPCWPTSKST